MKITEAIKCLEQIRKRHGDIRLHMEIGEDVPCEMCGDPKYERYTGFCRGISTINVNREIAVYLLADRD